MGDIKPHIDNPVRTGLIWGVTFLPMMAIVTRVGQDRWFSLQEWLVVVPSALAGGVFWAFVMGRIMQREGGNAR